MYQQEYTYSDGHSIWDDDCDHERYAAYRDYGPHKARGVSGDARLRNEGKGELRYTAPRDGKVFVQDAHDRKLITKFEVNEGDRIAVSGGSNEVTVNGEQPDVKKRALNEDHKNRIYFDAAPRSREERREERQEKENARQEKQESRQEAREERREERRETKSENSSGDSSSGSSKNNDNDSDHGKKRDR